MGLPEFLDNIQNAAQNPAGWLTPATVADLLESDFHTMRPGQREKLFQVVERFRTIAAISSPSPQQMAEARDAFDTIRDILQPYLTPESQKIRETIAKGWRKERAWIPTFDYQFANNWLDKPIVWIWLIIKDDVLNDEMEMKATTEEEWQRVNRAIRKEFNDAEIVRWPNIGLRTETDVKELQAGAIA
jgi:hypothetical protein